VHLCSPADRQTHREVDRETGDFPSSVSAMPILAGIKGQHTVIYIKNVLQMGYV